MANSLQSTKIGRFYKVPCVKALDNLIYARKESWIPVLLPMHEDAEIIGFPEPHYHLDLRFISNYIYAKFELTYFLAQAITKLTNPHWHPNEPRKQLTSVPKVSFRNKKCLRLLPDWYPHGRAPWMKKLEAKYKDSIMKNRICPHRGMDLSDCPIVEDRIICPMHGLTWNAGTGILISHCK